MIAAHLHIYTRSKPFNSWHIKDLSYDSDTNSLPKFIYQGLNDSGIPYPPMMVIGHSGTKHFFPQSQKPPKTYINPFIDVCNIEFASWVELDISSTELKVSVWNSGKGTKADEFTIVKGKTSPNDPSKKQKKHEAAMKEVKPDYTWTIIGVSLGLLFFSILVWVVFFKSKNSKDENTLSNMSEGGSKLEGMTLLTDQYIQVE